MIVPRAGLGKGIAGTGVLSRQIGAGAYRLELDGPSMRKIKAAEATERAPSAASAEADGKPPKGTRK